MNLDVHFMLWGAKISHAGCGQSLLFRADYHRSETWSGLPDSCRWQPARTNVCLLPLRTPKPPFFGRTIP
jgi:hypothetical protein